MPETGTIENTTVKASPAPPKGAVYFPGLNGIRAIACLMVFFTHFNQNADKFGITSAYDSGFGPYGVTLFFVLSGYLITYLLLSEKNKTGGIHVGKFYLRRIYRIWPLYYTCILIAVIFYSFIEPSTFSLQRWSTYLFFVPNLAYALAIDISIITPLWSVGVEEQFYLMWPWVLRKSNNVLMRLVIAALVYNAIKLLLRVVDNGQWYSLVWITRIDCMVIGGIGAWLVYYQRQAILKLFYNVFVQVAAIGVFLFSFYKLIHISTLFDHQIYALFFLVLILNVSTNKSSLIKLDNRVFDFVGKISYGVYMYHMIILLFAIHYLSDFFKSSHLPYLAVFGIILAVVLLVAYLSYNFLEAWFLKLKSRFAVVKSVNSKYSPAQ